MQRYGKELEQDAKNRLLGDMLNEGLKELKKDSSQMIGEPLVDKFDEKDGNLEVNMIVSFRPSVDISGYEALKPAYEAPKVEQKEIDAAIEELYQAIKAYADGNQQAKDIEVTKGDGYVFISFKPSHLPFR